MSKTVDFFSKGNMRPYEHVTTMLAPTGSFYMHGTSLFPVMYISIWKDPLGFMHTIPLWEEEFNIASDEFDNMQEFIEDRINEDRTICNILCCDMFIARCKGRNAKSIETLMQNYVDYIFDGSVNTTPELREYFKSGIWGDLRTMENDGSLCQGWEEQLDEEGALSNKEYKNYKQ